MTMQQRRKTSSLGRVAPSRGARSRWEKRLTRSEPLSSTTCHMKTTQSNSLNLTTSMLAGCACIPRSSASPRSFRACGSLPRSTRSTGTAPSSLAIFGSISSTLYTGWGPRTPGIRFNHTVSQFCILCSLLQSCSILNVHRTRRKQITTSSSPARRSPWTRYWKNRASKRFRLWQVVIVPSSIRRARR